MQYLVHWCRLFEMTLCLIMVQEKNKYYRHAIRYIRVKLQGGKQKIIIKMKRCCCAKEKHISKFWVYYIEM